MKKTMRVGWFGLAVVLLGGLIAACSGGTGDPATNEDFAGDEFVASDDETGSISLEVIETLLPVGEVTGFRVLVTNAMGSPVPGIQVSCDTEAGLAILEPTTGTEITDQYGQISGKLGCAAPGSLIVACRLPVGANKRKLVTVRCEGPIPEGFSGFPGAAGGGLGTGGVVVPAATATSDDANPPENVRITGVLAYDEGNLCSGTSTTSIDLIQGTCGTGSEAEPEPFFDTAIGVSVLNESGEVVRFTSLEYSVENVDGFGTQFNSTSIALVGTLEVAPDGGSTSFCTIFAVAASGGASNKKFIGADSTIAFTGLRNVTVRIHGRTASGVEVSLSARTALTFNNYNRCS